MTEAEFNPDGRARTRVELDEFTWSPPHAMTAIRWSGLSDVYDIQLHELIYEERHGRFCNSSSPRKFGSCHRSALPQKGTDAIASLIA
jgi:hypothetical protein